MNPLSRVAFIGTHLPRRCGIAAFTHDLRRAVATERPQFHTSVVAMTDPGAAYDYPASVRCQIRDDTISDYIQAAKFLNGEGLDVVSLQHEYGIFGGASGSNITELLSRLEMPLVTTLHTVLADPDNTQRAVMERIVHASNKIIVMSHKGRTLLKEVHHVSSDKIEIIPHGVPDFPFLESNKAKLKLGFSHRTVILTFGLLSPNKGIETVIAAMPQIIRSCPNAVYVVLGATHPNVMREDGEKYRESLVARVKELGLESHVVFFNQFVDQTTLLEFISMCDVYVTPYLNEAQMTSGTLAYSFALGKAIVSTPYWHASELLRDGNGILVPFHDSEAIAEEVSGLLTNDIRHRSLRKRAYAASRSMTWPQTARRYLSVFEEAYKSFRLKAPAWIAPIASPSKVEDLPDMKTDHFLSMCDNTGLLQHAVYSIPNRDHGYCIDDNARALLLTCILSGAGRSQFTERQVSQFAAFIQHAWNSNAGRFRNFMSYERRWLESQGSEDSHGRALWSLGVCVRDDTDPLRRTWAKSLFLRALPGVVGFSSPRSWAFTLLGLNSYCATVITDAVAFRIREDLASRLMMRLEAARTPEWHWFEDTLAYDNARLPQALLQTGAALGRSDFVDAGLKSLRWLMSLQRTQSGDFRPVGTQSFGSVHEKPNKFDQQPVEAAATISACRAAWDVNRCVEWITDARAAFGWFIGRNDLNLSLVDIDTGSCADGLHPDRINENRGAESTLSYLLALAEMDQFEKSLAPDNADRKWGAARSIQDQIKPKISGEIICLNQDL